MTVDAHDLLEMLNDRNRDSIAATVRVKTAIDGAQSAADAAQAAADAAQATADALSTALKILIITIGTDAAQASTTELPAGAVVLETRVHVQTPYSPGATITVGDAGNATRFQADTDNTATAAGEYRKGDVDLVPAASTVRVAVGGAPAAGAGFVVLFYVTDYDT